MMTHSGVMKTTAFISLLLCVFFFSFAASAFSAEFESGGYLRATYSIDTYYEDVWGTGACPTSTSTPRQATISTMPKTFGSALGVLSGTT